MAGRQAIHGHGNGTGSGMEQALGRYVAILGRDDMAEHLLDDKPSWIFAANGEEMLWANPAGLAFLDIKSLAALARYRLSSSSPVARRLQQLASRRGAAGGLERFRFFVGMRARMAACQCRQVVLDDGSTGILATAVDAAGAAADPLKAQFGLLEKAGLAAALLDEADEVVSATTGFQDLGLAADTPIGSLPAAAATTVRGPSGVLILVTDADALAEVEGAGGDLETEEASTDADVGTAEPAETEYDGAAAQVATAAAATGAATAALAQPDDTGLPEAGEPEERVVAEGEFQSGTAETPAADASDDVVTGTSDAEPAADALASDLTEAQPQTAQTTKPDAPGITDEPADAVEPATGEQAEETDVSASSEPEHEEPAVETAPIGSFAEAIDRLSVPLFADSEQPQEPSTQGPDETAGEVPEQSAADEPETVALAAPSPVKGEPPVTDEDAESDFVFSPGRIPTRFVWEMDGARRFSMVSEEFAATIGPRAADIVGKPWSEVSAQFGVDNSDISRAVEAGETWTGRRVNWPVEATDKEIPVELTALPIYDHGRTFSGYRGFGVCRTDQVRTDRGQRRGLVLAKACNLTSDTGGGKAPADDERRFRPCAGP